VQPLPDEIATVVWDGTGAPPGGRIEFFVPPFGVGNAKATPALSGLKVIQLMSAGLNRWDEFVPEGVTLCNASGVHASTTAELAVAGVLSLLRELPYFADQQRAARWSQKQAGTLHQRRVLIIGAGAIGTRAKVALEALGGDVTMLARTRRPGVYVLADLPELLPTMRVVILCVPETPSTLGLVDAAFLAALPDDSIVVNIARGSIVVTDDLINELNTGRIRALLDVFDDEPLPAGHPLWTTPNVLLTPHVASLCEGWQERAFSFLRDQVVRYVTGQPLANVVAGPR